MTFWNRSSSRRTSTSIFIALTLSASQASAQATRVKDINPGIEGSGPLVGAAEPVSGRMFFSADDGVFGTELWVTDGTSGGTAMVIDIWPAHVSDPSGKFSSTPDRFVAAGTSMYFVANDGSHGDELWVSDGSVGGTHRLGLTFDNPVSVDWKATAVPWGDSLYLFATHATSGRELLKITGTTVTVVKEINVGSSSTRFSGLALVNLDLYGERLLFGADDGVHGCELWISDGSESGTTMVKDIVPSGLDHSYPMHITGFGGKAFFWARNPANDNEIWVTDGTGSGTSQLKDTNPTGWGDPRDFTLVGEELFFTADDGVHGRELWATDGTPDGTRMVTDIRLGEPPSLPEEMTALGDVLLFTAFDDDVDDELWSSDGTPEGTTRVKNIHPDSSSAPMRLTGANGLVFFKAWDATHRYQLWVTDGTTAGTIMVAPVNPSFGEMIAVGGKLFFKALDSSNDLELWVLPLDDIVTAPETPDGASEANTGIATTYETGGSVSLNGNRVQYRFNWGDGSNSGWLDFGATSAEKTWELEGDHDVTAEARAETTNVMSNRSLALPVSVMFEEVVFEPELTGPTSGYIGSPITFTVTSGSNTDHELQYSVYWGDNADDRDWTSFPEGTATIELSKTWTSEGTWRIDVGVRCLDHWDTVEVWMDPFAEISITEAPPDLVFADDFEFGDLEDWSAAVGVAQ